MSQNNLEKLRSWYAPCRSRLVQIYHSRLRQSPTAGGTTVRKKVILCVGHFAAVKAQTVLVKAFSRIAKDHPDFVLKLAGHEGWDGELKRIREIVKDRLLENQVSLLGERTDTETLMREASIYVQPSVNEALGLALQEAMYYGCACIGSRTGGIPELIQHEQNGLLFETGNVEQLARALEQLIANPNRRDELGRAAAASIGERGMTSESMTRHYVKLYETAISKG